MRSTVAMLLERYEKEQDNLPPQPSRNAMTEVMLMIKDFSDDVTQAMFGQRNRTFVQENRLRYNDFKHAVQATCPDFRPFVNASDYPDPEHRIMDSEQGNPYAHLVSDAPASTATPMDLVAVRAAITDSVTWELPSHVPFDATERLIGEVTRNWEIPTFDCFREALGNLQTFLTTLITKHFSQFHRLEAMVKSIVFADLDVVKAVTEARLRDVLVMETARPTYTQNYEDLAQQKAAWLTTFQRTANNHSSGSANAYHEELQIMATVRAYYQVAYKRLIDIVPLTIEHQLNQPLAKGLSQSLIDQVTGDNMTSHSMQEKMESLLSEDPKVASRRIYLKERLLRLREIRDRLAQLGDGKKK